MVRKFSANDFAVHTGDVPVFNAGPEPRRPQEKDERKAEDKRVSDGVKMMRIALLSCCSALTLADGRKLRVVDKELDQAVEGEITIGELDDRDAAEIFQQVVDLSGIGREAASAAKTFPEEPPVAGDAGSTRAAVSPAAVGDAGAAGG